MVEFLQWTLLSVLIGFVLDLLLGDPKWIYHPVRLIGKEITALERALRKHCNTPKGEFLCGMLLSITVMLTCFGVPALLLIGAYLLSPYAYVVVSALLCWTELATTSLRKESMAVVRPLRQGDLPLARQKVSYIVGRDTDRLDVDGVVRATVETVAENTSDGVVAPLFYMFLGGAALGMLYKGVNTMDSMLGYRNETYFYFGKFAARADDVFNFLPARLSALFMILASLLCGCSFSGAVRIFFRDRYKHKSPNSAFTESVCAGALKIRLGGNAYYGGKLTEKPFLGDDLRPVAISDVRKACNLMTVTALLALGVFSGIWLLILGGAM